MREVAVGAFVFHGIEFVAVEHAVDVGGERLAVVGETEGAPAFRRNLTGADGVVGAPRKRATIGATGDATLGGDVRHEFMGAAVSRHVQQQRLLARAGVVIAAFALRPHTGDGAADLEIDEADDGEERDLGATGPPTSRSGWGWGVAEQRRGEPAGSPNVQNATRPGVFFTTVRSPVGVAAQRDAAAASVASAVSE